MLDPPDDVVDFRMLISEDLFYRTFPSYYDRGILPHAGGSLDQDPDIMSAMALGMLMVAWHTQNEKQADTEGLPDAGDW